METLLYVVLAAASAGLITATVLMFKVLSSKKTQKTSG
jgi:hypothetical protein